MSSIQFRNTPKEDLPQYSCIFRDTEPLGKDMNNVDCYRLGTMLHLEIQQREEAMKTLNFQKYLGWTVACMKRLVMDTKVCDQLTSNDTYFPGIWFSGVKTD